MQAPANVERQRQAIKPVTVTCLADIQRVIADYAPGASKDDQRVTVSTTMQAEGEGGIATYAVSAATTVKSRRAMLIDGLDVVKHYHDVAERLRTEAIPIEVNGVPMSTACPIGANPGSYIDPLIRHWFGGKRDGLRVRWDLADGYTYALPAITRASVSQKS